MSLPLLSGDAPLPCNGGELFQSFRRICIQQFFPPLGVNDLYLLRVSLEHNTAALALGQGAQSGKISASKQNGTSDKGVRAMCGPGSQPEDRPLCFFLCLGKCGDQGFQRLPLQQGLISGQENAACKVGALLQQRLQPQPNSVIPARQAVEQAGHGLCVTQGLDLGRAGHDHPGGKGRGGGDLQRPAEQGRPPKSASSLLEPNRRASPDAMMTHPTGGWALFFHNSAIKSFLLNLPDLRQSFQWHYKGFCDKIKVAIEKREVLRMMTIREYKRAESLEEAWQLNQKRNNRVIGGMIWLKMENINVGTAIDLSGLGLDKIEETAEGFSIGAMVPLRQIELHEGLNAYTEGAVRESVRHIVGVQLRSLATVGGSIYSRFGFSDVLTMFLALNASVELYKGGIVPLSEYAQRPYDRDILVRVIVPKEQAAFCYQSVRNSQTDFPVLTCAAAKTAGGFRFAIGARPGKAVLYTLQPNAAETPELTAARFAAEVRANIRTESNMRGSAEYRNHLAGVLVKRAVLKLEGNR